MELNESLFQKTDEHSEAVNLRKASLQALHAGDSFKIT